jgi:hypothetical protein
VQSTSSITFYEQIDERDNLPFESTEHYHHRQRFHPILPNGWCRDRLVPLPRPNLRVFPVP